MKLISILSSLLWCFDYGVSGICMDGKSVFVDEGESTTLDTNVKVIQRENIRWDFGDVRIAEITGDGSFVCTDVNCKDKNSRFKNRLQLDRQTGSLTIRNVRTTDTGVYKLQITSDGRRQIEKIFSVTVHGFFSFGADEESVFATEGDSVALHTSVETNQQETIRWYLNDIRVAQITRDQSQICTDVQCNERAERFRDRLQMENQTGALTITNIKITDSGVYRLRISSSSSVVEKIFIVAVYDIPEVDQMKRKSAKEGESVTLDTCLVNYQSYVMTLYLNDSLIFEITGNANKTCTDDQCEAADGRFRDRLKLDHQTGSLAITNTTIEDSGDYKLQINSSRFSIMKIFSVNVIASSMSSKGINAAAVGVGVILVVVVGAVIGVRTLRQRSKQARKNGNMMMHQIYDEAT